MTKSQRGRRKLAASIHLVEDLVPPPNPRFRSPARYINGDPDNRVHDLNGHSKDRGCSRPGCTVPGYQCQVHHVTDWAKGGLTDIDDLTLACGKDNRLVTENGWRT